VLIGVVSVWCTEQQYHFSGTRYWIRYIFCGCNKRTSFREKHEELSRKVIYTVTSLGETKQRKHFYQPAFVSVCLTYFNWNGQAHASTSQDFGIKI